MAAGVGAAGGGCGGSGGGGTYRSGGICGLIVLGPISRTVGKQPLAGYRDYTATRPLQMCSTEKSDPDVVHQYRIAAN